MEKIHKKRVCKMFCEDKRVGLSSPDPIKFPTRADLVKI